MRGALLAILGFFGLWGPPAPVPVSDIRFEGNDSFRGPQLLAILRNRYYLPLDGAITVTDADDAAFYLRLFYFSRGYRDASVTYTFTPSTPPTAQFVINEGPRVLIGTVRFEGQSVIPSDQLREIFAAAVRQATLRPFGRMRYVESAVEAGRLAIVNALVQRGCLRANATVETVPSTRDGLVDLVVRVEQGIQYFLRDVSFRGGPVDDATLRGVVADYLDQPFQRDREPLLRNRLLDWLRNHGYLQAKVTTVAALDDVSGRVAIAFDIEPGRVYRIGRVEIEGGSRTRRAAVRSRFAVAPGEIYDASEIDAAARRLWFTGAFAEATVERVPHEDGTVDLILKVEEAPAKRVQFALGYSEWDGGYAEVHYIDRDFFGTLNRLNLDATVSQRSYGISGAITDPWLFGTDFEASIGASLARRELPAYRAVEAGTTVSLTRRFNADTLTGYRVQYGYKVVTDAVIFGDDVDVPDPNYTLGSLAFSQTYDSRNSVLSPMQGLFLSYELELADPALLGNISFLRASAQATWYFPLRPITPETPFPPFLVFNHRAGVLLPYGSSSNVPVQERFFLGGPNTVRSFQLDGLGPRDRDGDPLGGLAMQLWNAEIQWPVINNVYVAAFADAGNLWSDATFIQPFDLQVGVGPGLRVYTPLGAIRVDYGYNLNRQTGDPVGAWQIGFGFTF